MTLAVAVVGGSPVFSVSGWQEAPHGKSVQTSCTASNPALTPSLTSPQPPGASGTITCTTSYTSPAVSYHESASVSESSANLNGSVNGDCSTSKSGSVQRTVTFVNGNGQGGGGSGQSEETDDCTVQFTFSDGSSLNMTLHAHDVEDQQGNILSGGVVTGQIVAGTGVYAGQVGSWSQSEGAHDRVLSLRGDHGFFWKASLHKGASEVAIAYPSAPKLTATYDPGLRVVAASGQTCTASASSGAKTVKLGTGTTAKVGSVLLAPKLIPFLHSGAWTISVACGSASAKRQVTVGS